MDNLSPDFVRFWLGSDADLAAASSRAVDDDEASVARQSDALQALAERITAARSIL